MFKKNSNYLIKTPLGFEPFKGVQKKIVGDMYTFSFANGNELKCSGNHLLLTDVGFQKAKNITSDQNISGKFITNISHETGFFEVYDPVGVESNSYLSEGVISHNTDFIGSSDTLIGGPYLKRLMEDTADSIIVSSKNKMDVYEEAQKGHKYVISVDVSEGVGLDYSAFQVIDITEFPYKQVATYRNKDIHTLFYPEVIYNAALTYNKANILVETNKVGTVVANSLFLDYEWENMLGSIIRNQRAGQELVAAAMSSGKSRLGVEMTKSVKKIGCAYLKHLVEDKKLIIKDNNTAAEFSTFIKHLDSYQAEEGCHDDLITPLIIFAWACKQEMFLALVDIDIRQKMIAEHELMIEHEILPFPKVNYGPGVAQEDVWVDGDGVKWEVVGSNE